MRHFLVTLTIFLFWSLLGIWFFALINPNEATAATKDPNPKVNKAVIEVLPIVEEESASKAAAYGFHILDVDGATVYSDSEGFQIKKNTAEVDDTDLRSDYKEFVKGRLEEDPYLRLSIIGIYSAEENIVQPNYGLQRAEDVQAKLAQAGVPLGRSSLKASISPLQFERDTYGKGVQFQFYKVEEAWTVKMGTETLTWYPYLEYDDVKEDAALRALYLEVQKRIEADPDANVVVVGHTDQVGSIRDNYKTGLKWAKQVRSLLIRKTSLNWRKVSAESQGEMAPINNDGTLAAGKENKRIEIIIN